MSVDLATVKRVAHLARIAVPEADLPKLQGELNAILGFVEQLNEVNVDGVEPMTSVTPMAMTVAPLSPNRRRIRSAAGASLAANPAWPSPDR